MKRDNRYWRAVAGNLELFLGGYLMSFGILAVLFFARRENRNAALLSAVGVLIGALFVMRAQRLLGWHRWIFWFIVFLMITVPTAWFIPVLVRFR
jgi:hypothetical protein